MAPGNTFAIDYNTPDSEVHGAGKNTDLLKREEQIHRREIRSEEVRGWTKSAPSLLFNSRTGERRLGRRRDDDPGWSDFDGRASIGARRGRETGSMRERGKESDSQGRVFAVLTWGMGKTRSTRTRKSTTVCAQRGGLEERDVLESAATRRWVCGVIGVRAGIWSRATGAKPRAGTGKGAIYIPGGVILVKIEGKRLQQRTRRKSQGHPSPVRARKRERERERTKKRNAHSWGLLLS
ncbi:hypothetical protein C8J57DRAFT_1234010 [Mycena rebaudengoi]|nr:hypothetical protein C8J57DRAFT_1234010 [Mycena rebaudengoi]